MKDTDREQWKKPYSWRCNSFIMEPNDLSDNTVTGRWTHSALDKYKCVSVNEGVRVYVSFSASTTLLNDWMINEHLKYSWRSNSWSHLWLICVCGCLPPLVHVCINMPSRGGIVGKLFALLWYVEIHRDMVSTHFCYFESVGIQRNL